MKGGIMPRIREGGAVDTPAGQGEVTDVRRDSEGRTVYDVDLDNGETGLFSSGDVTQR